MRFEPDAFPVYDAIFAQPGIDWDVITVTPPGEGPRTLRESIERAATQGAVPTPEFARRMREYEAAGGVGLPYGS